jgi:hypothetical protein
VGFTVSRLFETKFALLGPYNLQSDPQFKLLVRIIVFSSFFFFFQLVQMQRLLLCEKMIVAMELAGWLNEANHALQAVVQCYGLLAPMLYYKIPALPVIQV